MGARIESGSVRIVWEPTSARLTTSYGEAPAERPHVIVELRTDDGTVGWGEASPLEQFTGETVDSIKVMLEIRLLPLVVGQDPFAIAAIHARLDSLPHNPSARSALDMACHDLMGRLSGRPVHDFLGGACRDTVVVDRPIGILPTDEAVREAEAYVERGYRTLKLKIGVDRRRDAERALAIRRAVGPEVRIRVDGNQGYTVPDAIRALRAMEAADLDYVEQPVPAWDHAGLAEVRRATGLPVMADEAVHTLRDALSLIEHRAADVFALKLIKTGGLYRARQIAALAEAAGIAIVVISTFDTHLGAAAGVHLALSIPNAARHAQELSIFTEQPGRPGCDLVAERDLIRRPTAPGLGVDWSLAEGHARRQPVA